MKIVVNIRQQVLELWQSEGDGTERLLARYPVSTAALGSGEQQGSFQTPRGRHVIAEKIGAGLPAYAVLRGRQPTGDIWSTSLSEQHPDADWILSRILWLSGTEPGVNSGGQVDSHDRYIYIHGTDQEHLLGTPASHGCIRMANSDVIELYDRVEAGTPVDIRAD